MEQTRPMLDDQVIRNDLKNFLDAVVNKIEREWPPYYAHLPELKNLIKANAQIAVNSRSAIRYLCADNPPDNQRKPGFTIAAFPIARTVLESLFSCVFLFNDIETNLPWYFRASLKEEYEIWLRRKGEYSKEPNWADFLDKQEAYLTKALAGEGIDASKPGDVKKIRRWPLPGKMKRDKTLLTERKQFLAFLHRWFYPSLSSAAHLKGPALFPAAQLLSGEDIGGPYGFTSQLYKSEVVFTVESLVLALFSEFISELSFDLSEEAKYLWTILAEHWPDTKLLYEKRYQALL